MEQKTRVNKQPVQNNSNVKSMFSNSSIFVHIKLFMQLTLANSEI